MGSLYRSAALGAALSLLSDLGFAAGVAAAGLAQAAPAPLPVPHISQIYPQSFCPCACDGARCPEACLRTSHPNGHNNCGPASVAMIVDANGRRPPGLTDQAFVAQLRQTMTDQPDGPCNPTTDWSQLDAGARAFGLCLRGRATDGAERIFAMNAQCIPVIGLVATSPAHFPGLDNASFHKNAAGRFGDHFVVILGQSGETVFYHNPLVWPAPARLGAPKVTTRAILITALQNAQVADWGRGYGDPLGGCDGVGRCNDAAGGGGGAAGGAPRPQFDRIQLSLGHTCADNRVAIFFRRTDQHTFHERRKVTLDAFHQPHGFSTHVIEMPSSKGWSGTIEALRIDPVDGRGDTSCRFALSYVHVRSSDGQTAAFFPFYAHAGRVGRPLGRLLDWSANGDLDDAGPCCEPDGSPRRSWHLDVDGRDPQLVHPTVRIDTGRD